MFRLIDVDGGQVADLFAFVDAPAGDGADAAALSEWMSAEHTRPGIKRLFPRPGDVALTNRRRPILRLEDDASPGWHDTLYAACDPARYALLGHGGPHRSCATNLVEALRDVGRELPGMPEPIVPQPFNVFMHVEVGPEGVLQLHPATSRAGDSLTFRALTNCIVAVSSCPMDLVDISTGGITPLLLQVTGG